MRLLTSLLAIHCCALALPHPSAGQRQPPMAKRVPKVDTLHGDIRRDDYYWLREKSNPEVRRYLEAENAYTEASLAHAAPLRDTLYREMLVQACEDVLNGVRGLVRVREQDAAEPGHPLAVGAVQVVVGSHPGSGRVHRGSQRTRNPIG